MAAIVNERDLILQATVPRLEPIALPDNISIHIDDVIGAGVLAHLDVVDGLTQVTNLGDLAFADTIVANQVIAGVFTGLSFRTSASGTRVEIDGPDNSLSFYSGLDRQLYIGGPNGTIVVDASFIPGIWAQADGGVAAIQGDVTSALVTGAGVRATSNGGSVAMVASSSGGASTNHAIRAQHTGVGSAGLVGAANGYAFYDEAGGYGPFTGAHDAVVPNGFVGEPGDIMIDGEVVRTRGVSDVLMTAALSATIEQQGAIGVLDSIIGPMSEVRPAAMMEGGIDPDTGLPCMCDEWEDYADTHQVVKINAVGEGLINVCGRNGNLAKGDLIVCSDMPGKGQKQNDGIIRNTTVARARVAVTFNDPDEVKLVPCIYLCG